MEKLHAPLRIVQQPVLSEVHRVHAGRRGQHAIQQVVRRLPRSRRFFNGRFDKPIKEQIDTPEAQNGLGCMSCHSIVHRATAPWATADSRWNIRRCTSWRPARTDTSRAVDHFLTYLNPEPHRRTFLKPFMRQDSAEFCASCHKVHLDVPVNNYRWLRGFNDYDNWQASGVSGQGARSFYYPPKSSTCADCHMPLVPSQRSRQPRRQGSLASLSRRRIWRVAYVNQDEAQLQGDGRISEVRLHHGGYLRGLAGRRNNASDTRWCAARAMRRRRCPPSPSAKKREQTGPAVIREVGKIAAPIDRARAQACSPVRPRAWTPWCARARSATSSRAARWILSMSGWNWKRSDADGRMIFWSGKVEDNGRGPVEPGAHFYRSYQLDGDGNVINKRNAFQARSVLYVRLIPPGAADVAHFRVQIPKDAQGPDHAHGEAELPQVRALLHAVRLCRTAEAGPDRQRCWMSITTAGSSLSRKRISRPMFRARSRADSRSPDRHPRAAHDGQLPLGDADMEAGGRKKGPRALERLGHRAAAARRSERRGVRVQEGDRSRARLCRRLAERGARA